MHRLHSNGRQLRLFYLNINCRVIFSSFCMCLMDYYINIDNEFVSKNPEILVTRWIQEICQNSCFVKLCSFRIIIHVCNDSYKTFLNVRFFITGGLLCITKSRIWNSLLRETGASECIGCTEPYTDRLLATRSINTQVSTLCIHFI